MTRILLAATLLPLTACVEIEGPTRCWAVTPTPAGDAVPLVEGARMPIVNGPPLWPMVTFGIAAENLDPGNAEDPTDPTNPQYVASLAAQGWGELSSRRGKVGFEERPDGTLLLPEVRLVFEWQPPMPGVACRLTFAVVDQAGHSCSQILSVVPEKR